MQGKRIIFSQKKELSSLARRNGMHVNVDPICILVFPLAVTLNG